MNRASRLYVARHGETVFNAAGRMQGGEVHTPLTRAGFAQADAIGAALAEAIGELPPLAMWASDAGRALQTLAIVAEHLGLDWHGANIDPRLREIDVGRWGGRSYAEVIAESGDIVDRATGLFAVPPPGGEWYDAIAARLASWLDDLGEDHGDLLVIMHGMSSRVLRGLLTGCDALPEVGAPVAPRLPQGTIVMIENGRETVIHRGSGESDR